MPADVWTEGAASTVGLTLGRQTRAVLDVDHSHALLEGQWGGLRMGPQIAPTVALQRSAESKWHRAVHLWATGAWTLRPLQMQLSRVQEQGLPTSVVFAPAAFPGTPAGLQLHVTSQFGTKALWAQKSGVGLAAGTGVNASGLDIFYKMGVAAGASWASDLVGAPAWVDTLPTLLATWKALTYPLDTVAYSDASQAADTGYCLRIIVPGVSGASHPDYIGVFYFGQYAIALAGDGVAKLFEYEKVGTARAWAVRKSFRWASQSQVSGHSHVILIYPHVGSQGQKFIVFAVPSLDAATPADMGDASFGSSASRAGAISTGEAVFRWDPALTGSEDLAGDGYATIAGPIYLKERRDLRCEWQISRLAFETAGTLTDLPWAMDKSFTARTIATNVVKREPAGSTTIIATVADAYNVGLTGDNIADPYVAFAFAGPGDQTPILWGYKINRQPVIGSHTGQIAAPIVATSIGLGESDPRSESCDVSIEDPKDEFPRLRNRGELSFRLQTLYQPAAGGDPETVVLFRGALLRPQRRLKGKAGVAAARGTTGTRVFPSAQWSRYEGRAAGMWHYLCKTTSRTALSYENFAYDSTAGLDAQGNQQPWRVTDAIKVLLKTAGFPDAMQDIPDLDIRLRAGAGTDTSDQILDPGTNIAQQVIRLAAAYLGRFLVFDANAGSLGGDGVPTGAWKLIAVPAADSTSLLDFTTAPPAAGKVLTLRAYTYPAVPVFEGVESFVEPPEHNHLWAFSVASLGGSSGIRVDNHAYNFESYAVPNSGVTLDVDNPHYLGDERLLAIGDPALWGGAASLGYQATQTVLDYVLFRLFTYTCLARRVVTFEAPLEMVWDAGLSRYRPPRYYDHVTYNGTNCYIRSVDIAYDRDGLQVAHYTLESLVPYPTLP